MGAKEGGSQSGEPIGAAGRQAIRRSRMTGLIGGCNDKGATLRSPEEYQSLISHSAYLLQKWCQELHEAHRTKARFLTPDQAVHMLETRSEKEAARCDEEADAGPLQWRNDENSKQRASEPGTEQRRTATDGAARCLQPSLGH